jgi:hypothetical protein
MVGLRDTGILLVQEPRGYPTSCSGKMFYMPTGAWSRGYKLRPREGKCPKSLDVDVSYDARSLSVVCCVCSSHWTLLFYGAGLPFNSLRRSGVQGLGW